MRNVERLEQIIVGAEFGGFDGGVGGAERRDQNDGQARLGGVQLANQFQPVQARQFQIGDDDVERFLAGAGQTVIAALFDVDFVAFLGQHPLQRVRDAGVVFDQQYSGRRRSCSRLAATRYQRSCRDSPGFDTAVRRRAF